MIDLTRFAATSNIVLPITEGYGIYRGRVFSLPGLEDNWYMFSVGNKIDNVRRATALEIRKTIEKESFKPIRFYAIGDEGVPVTFGKKTGTTKIYFNNLPLFRVAKATPWHDSKFYFYDEDPAFQRPILDILEKLFKEEKSIGKTKEVTPELRYYYLIARLDHASENDFDQILSMNISEVERKKILKKAEGNFDIRLKKEIERAGGKLVNFRKANGNSYLVTWTIGNQEVKTTIKDNFSVLSLGYCASGDDRRHSLASAVQLAKMFKQNKPLYITRE